MEVVGALQSSSRLALKISRPLLPSQGIKERKRDPDSRSRDRCLSPVLTTVLSSLLSHFTRDAFPLTSNEV